MDVAKVAEREARHEDLREPRSEDASRQLSYEKLSCLGDPASHVAMMKEIKVPNLTDMEKAIIDLAVQGKQSATIAKTLGLPLYVVQATRRQNRIQSIILLRQTRRKQTIDNAKDVAEVQALENLIAAGEAIAEAIEKIATGGQQVEMVDKLLSIYQDMQDRVGFPIVKRTDTRSTHADLGNPVVARLLTQNQKFRAIDGGRAEVIPEESAAENDTQPNADSIEPEERTG